MPKERMTMNNRRYVNGVSMKHEAWDKALDHASAQHISVSRLLEQLVLALPEVRKEEHVVPQESAV